MSKDLEWHVNFYLLLRNVVQRYLLKITQNHTVEWSKHYFKRPNLQATEGAKTLSDILIFSTCCETLIRDISWRWLRITLVYRSKYYQSAVLEAKGMFEVLNGMSEIPEAILMAQSFVRRIHFLYVCTLVTWNRINYTDKCNKEVQPKITQVLQT